MNDRTRSGGWIRAILLGLVLGVTSYWHGQAGGAGTTGGALAGPLVVAAVLVCGALTVRAWRGRAR